MHFVDVNKFGKNRIFTTPMTSAKQLNSIEIMSTFDNIYKAVQSKRPPYKGTNWMRPLFELFQNYTMNKRPRYNLAPFNRITHKGIKRPLYHIKVEGHMLYYGCYFPRLVTERGLGVARIISFFNSIYHSRCN